MANFEAKNTVKQGKKTPKGQMVPISRVYRGGGGGKTYRAILGGGGETYCKVPPPNPVLEVSESGICLVCARFL